MSAWVLLIFLRGYNAATAQQVDGFASRTACEIAAQVTRDEIAKQSVGGYSTFTIAYCVERKP